MGKKIKVVLSGSGTRYPVHLGGLIRLVEEGYEVSEICGTSGGSIVATGVALGYDIKSELPGMMIDLLPSKTGALKYSLISLFLKWGFINGDGIEKLFSKFTNGKLLGDTKIPLHIVTTNLDRQVMRVFSSETDPKMCIAKAVRASVSIPGVFTPVMIDKEMYVDGGLVGNYLIDRFGYDDDVFGFRFEDILPVTSYKEASYKKITNVREYLSANVDSIMNANAREHIEDALFARTITMRTRHDGLNFKMTEKDVEEMISDGYDSVDFWLTKGRGSDEKQVQG